MLEMRNARTHICVAMHKSPHLFAATHAYAHKKEIVLFHTKGTTKMMRRLLFLAVVLAAYNHHVVLSA